MVKERFDIVILKELFFFQINTDVFGDIKDSPIWKGCTQTWWL